MKWLILFSLVAATSAGREKWTEMRVKYGNSSDGADKDFLYKVPITLAAANSGRWQTVDLDNDLKCTFVGVSAGDYGFNPLYDANGFLAGAQLCQPLATIQETGPQTYYLPDMGTVEVKSIKGVDYFCTTFLIVDPVVLKAGGRNSGDSLGQGLWLRDTTNTETGYKHIPDDVDSLISDAEFVQQRCFPDQGTHYYYKLSKNLDCNKFYSWFPLGQGNDVTGIGLAIFGHKTVFNYDWYDYVPRAAIEYVVPDANECLYNWVDLYTVTSVHVFFTDAPWDIECAS